MDRRTLWFVAQRYGIGLREVRAAGIRWLFRGGMGVAEVEARTGVDIRHLAKYRPEVARNVA